MSDGPPHTFTVAFFIIFGVVATIIVCGWIFTGYAIARRRRALKDAGLDPMAADIQIAQRVANSELFAPQQSLEQRLAELDDLHRRGLISDDERVAARAKALAGG